MSFKYFLYLVKFRINVHCCMIIVGFFLFNLFSCTKNNTTGTATADSTVVQPQQPTDPAVANTIGFFMNNWQAKTFSVPSYTDTSVTAATSAVTVTINPSAIITKIPPSIYGNNANVFMSQMVTEPGLLSSISNLQPHIIRFPGGSLSDLYFWNKVSNPPADAPATLPDANGNPVTAGYWYGGNTASWTMSLDHYYQMLQQTGNQGIITVNYAYARYGTGLNPVAAAAHLAADWVRYDNGRTQYWEIGNENYGNWETGYLINTATNKDGQPKQINGSLYGQHFQVFADSMRSAAQQIGKTIYISAVMIEQIAGNALSTTEDINWDTELLSTIGNTPDFYSVHSYYTPFQENSTVTTILNSAQTVTYDIMNWMKAICTSTGLTQKPVALTEWNINAVGSMQEVSYINGMHATLLLGQVLLNYFGLACRWDFANAWNNGNDQGMFNAGDEPGGVPKWNPRPPFYYMYYFQKTAGDRLINSTVTGNTNMVCYASSYTSGQVAAALINMGNTPLSVNLKFQNFTPGNRYYWYTLTGGTDNGNFSRQVYVNGTGPSYISGGPSNYASLNAYSSLIQNAVSINVPALSVVYMIIDK